MSEYVVVSGMTQAMSNAEFSKLMMAVLARGAPFRFQASGFSMFPFICDGDVITVAPATLHFHMGEVAVFMNPVNDRLTVHRVVRVLPAGYILRGDSIDDVDGFVPREDILGHVIHVERGGRRVRLGLGIERIFIAALSQRGWLIPFIAHTRSLIHFFRGYHE